MPGYEGLRLQLVEELSLRSGAIEDGAPLSLTTYTTRGEVRGIRWRRLP